jgi:hypothetical protein
MIYPPRYVLTSACYGVVRFQIKARDAKICENGIERPMLVSEKIAGSMLCGMAAPTLSPIYIYWDVCEIEKTLRNIPNKTTKVYDHIFDVICH